MVVVVIMVVLMELGVVDALLVVLDTTDVFVLDLVVCAFVVEVVIPPAVLAGRLRVLYSTQKMRTPVVISYEQPLRPRTRRLA